MSIHRFVFILGVFALGSPRIVWGQELVPGRDDSVQIVETARDYIEGWYAADAVRMERALHPDMVKRYVDAMPNGRQVVQGVTRDIMVEMTRMGGGSKTAPDQQGITVAVLEISGDIAVAKTVSVEYVDYLSLAKCNGRWVIVNVLWRFQTPPTPTP